MQTERELIKRIFDPGPKYDWLLTEIETEFLDTRTLLVKSVISGRRLNFLSNTNTSKLNMSR